MRMINRIMLTGLGAVIVSLFGTLMALVFLQVVNRMILGLPLFWTEEVVRLLLVWTVLLATPLTLLLRHEIAVDLLSFRNPVTQRGKIVLSTAASVIFCIILAKTGYEFTIRGLRAQSMTLGISRAWFYAPIPIGAVLSIIALLTRPADDGSAASEDKAPL